MVKGICRSPSTIFSYNGNAASTQADVLSFQNRLMDKSVNSDNNLNKAGDAMQELVENSSKDLNYLQLEQALIYQRQDQKVRNTISQHQGNADKGSGGYSNRPFNGLDILGPSAPDKVKDAWMKAEEETGVNGYGMNGEGMLTQITMLFAMSIENMVNGGGRDILGNTVDSAKAVVQRALERLEIPQNEKEKKEQLFYEAFLYFLD